MRRQTRLLVESLESRRLLAAVTIPTTLTAAPGSVAAAPVQIDSASGVRAAEIRLSYDTTKLDITSDAISAGSVWAGNSDTQVTANVNDAAGTIVLFVTSANPLTNIAGSLAVLNFTVASNASAGSTAILNLTAVELNEGAVSVTPAPTAGADSTDGLITITTASTGNGSISGFVFADANRSNAIDAGEAIAGVVIVLTNSTTGATQQTTTASDGSYTFSNLVAGSYQLQQQQPAAYFDGGVNSLSVQVAAGSNLTNQNFVEGGLQPGAIFTRLRTTLVMPVGSTAWQNTISNIVSTYVASSSSSSSSSTSTTLQSLSAPALSSTPASNTSGLTGEGEYSAPIIVPSAVVNSAVVNSAAPPVEVETHKRQRSAAVDHALLDF